MNKGIRTYIVLWAIAFAGFVGAVVAFPTKVDGATVLNIVKTVKAIKEGITGTLSVKLTTLAAYLEASGIKDVVFSKYGGGFWTGFCAVVAAYLLHLVFFIYAYSEKNKNKQMANTPVMVKGCFELLGIMIIGIACMVIPDLPNWLAVVLCAMVVGVSVIKLTIVRSVELNKHEANDRLNERLSRMKELTAKAEQLKSYAKNEEEKKLIHKLVEEIKYSNPVSNESTKELEDRISLLLDELKSEISAEKISTLLSTLEEKNNKM